MAKEINASMNKAASNMINIIIVDDHKLVRTGIRRLLEDISGVMVLGEAANGDEAMQVVRQTKPDVVLMDIKMPGLDGLAMTRKLSRLDSHLKIIIVTSYDNDIFPRRVMGAGAWGYLIKGAKVEEMVKAIRTVNMGKKYLSPEIAKRIALKKMLGEKFQLDELSDHELQVMQMVAQGEEVSAIAKKLHLSAKTVNSYRYRIFKKLKITNDIELMHYALKKGLLDSDEINL